VFEVKVTVFSESYEGETVSDFQIFEIEYVHPCTPAWSTQTEDYVYSYIIGSGSETISLVDLNGDPLLNNNDCPFTSEIVFDNESDADSITLVPHVPLPLYADSVY
jgi:hypothetical protein